MTNEPKPFNPFQAYETNQDAEVDGVWLVEPFFRMRVARAGGRNRKFQTRYDALTKPYKRAIQTKTLPAEIDEDLSKQLYAEAVVTNWSIPEEVIDGKPKRDANNEIIWRDGFMYDPVSYEPIPFNSENVKRTFDDPVNGRGAALHQYVVAMSNDVTTYRDEDAEDEDEKN